MLNIFFKVNLTDSTNQNNRFSSIRVTVVSCEGQELELQGHERELQEIKEGT